MKKLLLIFVLLVASVQMNAQNFKYNWIESTGEVTSFDEHVFTFNSFEIYDETSETFSSNETAITTTVIQKQRGIDFMSLYLDNDTVIHLTILSCYVKTYNNSENTYFQFLCYNKEEDKQVYYFLDNNEGWRLWCKITGSERLYFLS